MRAEAGAYTLSGYLAASLPGLLQQLLVTHLLPRLQGIWHASPGQLALALLVVVAIALVATIAPLRRIRGQRITQVINSL